jgi:hypothetical protein
MYTPSMLWKAGQAAVDWRAVLEPEDLAAIVRDAAAGNTTLYLASTKALYGATKATFKAFGYKVSYAR